MLIHAKMEASVVNGPGERAVIWFQGCSLHCKGCWNPDTHNFDGQMETPVYELVDWVVSNRYVEGVTFSGGEPLQQAPWLFVLMTEIHRLRPELSFGLFTGYSLKELEQGRYRWKSQHDGQWHYGSRELWYQIKGLLDFAVLGRYNQLLATKDKPLCGSRNQEVVFFTDRYSEADLGPQEVEMVTDGSGLIQISGFPVGVKL